MLPRVGRFALLVVLTAFLRLALQVVVVPTPSMEGTVLVGDHLLIDRFAYGPEIPFTHYRLPRLKNVRRGDLVSFHPPVHSNEVYLKRVVAVGGDRVQWRCGALYVNGNREPEPNAPPAPAENSPEFVVPSGQIYLLGDNRNHSEDSRLWGTVAERNVIGEPMLVLWSFASPTAQWLRSATAAYFDHPLEHFRWRRLFRRVD